MNWWRTVYLECACSHSSSLSYLQNALRAFQYETTDMLDLLPLHFLSGSLRRSRWSKLRQSIAALQVASLSSLRGRVGRSDAASRSEKCFEIRGLPYMTSWLKSVGEGYPKRIQKKGLLPDNVSEKDGNNFFAEVIFRGPLTMQGAAAWRTLFLFNYTENRIYGSRPGFWTNENKMKTDYIEQHT